MREYNPNANWDKSAYLIGIAHRLKIEPWRVECNFRVGKGGAFLFDVRIDGRDPTTQEERMIAEYFEEALKLKPRVEGSDVR